MVFNRFRNQKKKKILFNKKRLRVAIYIDKYKCIRSFI